MQLQRERQWDSSPFQPQTVCGGFVLLFPYNRADKAVFQSSQEHVFASHICFTTNFVCVAFKWSDSSVSSVF